MIKNLFVHKLHVKVYPNRFVISELGGDGKQISCDAERPFTTQRLLVGDFAAAEACLQKALRGMTGRRLFRPRPAILLQPMAMIEGGLSPVEDRVFRELAFGGGAFKVVIYIGGELSQAEASVRLLERGKNSTG